MEPKTVIVTFDYGDKEVVSGGNVVSISYVVGSDYSDFPSPVYKEPYIFVGWSTSESEYKRPVITSDITLYAIVEEETDINAFRSFQTDTISNVVFQDCKYSASGLNVLAVWRPATGINYIAGFEELAKYFTKCDITQEIIKVDAPLNKNKQ